MSCKVVFVLLLAAVLTDQAEAACSEPDFGVPHAELPTELPEGQNVVGQPLAGALQWTRIPEPPTNDCDAVRWEMIVGPSRSSIDVVTEYESARVVSWRIPSDAPVDSHIEVRRFCRFANGGSIDTLDDAVIVQAGVAVLERAAPVLGTLEAELIQIETPADCFDSGPPPDPIPLATLLATIVSGDVVSEANEETPLLLDAWLLERGIAPSTPPNFAEAAPVVLVGGELALRFSEPGELTLHVRVRDSATGDASEIRVIEVSTPDAIYPAPSDTEPSEASCTSTSSPAPLVMLLLSLAASRNRRGAVGGRL